MTYQNHYTNGSGKTPDEGVVDRQPTEVRVSISLRIQTHSQTWWDI